MLNEFQSATQAMADAGILVDSGALQPSQTATTIRVRDGKAELSDGPFAEIKEQLGAITSWTARIWIRRCGMPR